jgi:hypothetical protein
MLPAGALASGLDHDAAADVLWTIASPETGLLFRRTRGWTMRQHQSWLARTLVRSLLRPHVLPRTPAAPARRRA